MPRVRSGQRFCRSFLSPTGAANEVSAELDFQLGGDDGIEIFAVQGYGSLHDDSPAASDTVPYNAVAHQTLHLEAGETEDLPDAAGEDGFDIDSEIFWVQHFVQQGHIPATAGGGGAGLTITPSGLVVFDKPILSPRNITHKATTLTADQDLECGVIIHYRYVSFSSSELGVLLARR